MDLLESGRKVADVARDLEISDQTICVWRRQDRVDKGRAGPDQCGEGRADRGQEADRRAGDRAGDPPARERAVGEGGAPKRRFEAITVMASEGLPVQPAAKALGCSVSGYYASLVRAPSARHERHALLTETIRTIHTASRGVYGARRVHAKLTKGHDIQVWHGTVEMLMARAGLKGVGGRPKWRRARPDLISTDHVDRQFARDGVNELWVTDITERPT